MARQLEDARASLHCDGFGQVPGLVDVAAFYGGYIVGQELQRDDGQQGDEAFFGVGDFYGVVGQWMLLTTLSYMVLLLGATTTTGISWSMRAMGPCFISAAGYPSAWM